MTQRTKIGMLVAEFFGTAVLTSTVLAQANSNVIVNKTWFIAATAGLTLAMLVLAIGKVSGAHVNPAVTIGLWTLRKVQTTTAVAMIAAQFLGAVVALRLFQYFQNDVLNNIAGKFSWHIMWAETIGALVFGFGIAAAVTQKLEGYAKAYAIGVSLMLGALVASTASNGFLNPAVALGNNSWSWIYVTAPIVGMTLGMNIYDMFLAPESELKSSVSASASKAVASTASASKASAVKKSAKKSSKNKKR